MRSYLSLGSNEGDKQDNLGRALELLREFEGIEIMQISSIYETEPWGGVKQQAFYNLTVEIETSLDPEMLLQACQEIENKLGRKRLVHWGSRTIDIDILSYQETLMKTESLTIPHPYMESREFVLAPLREVAPDFVLPSGKTVSQVQGEGKVKKLNKSFDI